MERGQRARFVEGSHIPRAILINIQHGEAKNIGRGGKSGRFCRGRSSPSGIETSTRQGGSGQNAWRGRVVADQKLGGLVLGHDDARSGGITLSRDRGFYHHLVPAVFSTVSNVEGLVQAGVRGTVVTEIGEKPPVTQSLQNNQIRPIGILRRDGQTLHEVSKIGEAIIVEVPTDQIRDGKAPPMLLKASDQKLARQVRQSIVNIAVDIIAALQSGIQRGLVEPGFIIEEDTQAVAGVFPRRCGGDVEKAVIVEIRDDKAARKVRGRPIHRGVEEQGRCPQRDTPGRPEPQAKLVRVLGGKKSICKAVVIEVGHNGSNGIIRTPRRDHGDRVSGSTGALAQLDFPGK